MQQNSNRVLKRTVSTAAARTIDIQQLHEQCGVYTQPALVRRTLDACGWTRNVDLSRSSLLEPCAGNGSFLIEAARRLLQSLELRRISASSKVLRARILAYELVPAEANKARQSITALLSESGLKRQTAVSIAKSWVRTGDFLLNRPKRRRFTYVVGNPPYVRWSRVPARLRAKYEEVLPAGVARGDLQLPFLSIGVDTLIDGGKLGYVCSDRWRHMEYGAKFKAGLFEKALVETHPIKERPPFSRRVDAYADLLIVTNTQPQPSKVCRINISKRRSLAEFGCSVKVGPALGFNKAFLGTLDELQIERELCNRFIRPTQIRDGAVTSEDLWVIAMHDRNGVLRNLSRYPLLAARMAKYSSQLRQRSIALKGGVWYRPIDLVQQHVWALPKLVIPEIAKVPRIAKDLSGAIPSHAVYAILGPITSVEEVYSRLAGDGLAKALNGLAPQIKGGYFRCYKRFLNMIIL